MIAFQKSDALLISFSPSDVPKLPMPPSAPASRYSPFVGPCPMPKKDGISKLIQGWMRKRIMLFSRESYYGSNIAIIGLMVSIASIKGKAILVGHTPPTVARFTFPNRDGDV